MSDDKITVKLNPTECDLILEYGYPFDDVKKIAEKSKATGKNVTLRTEKYCMEILVGDLSYSANREKRRHIWEELDVLCSRLESECGL